MKDESRRALVNAMRDPGTKNTVGFFVEEESGAIRDIDERYVDGDIDSTAYIAALRAACAPAKADLPPQGPPDPEPEATQS